MSRTGVLAVAAGVVGLAVGALAGGWYLFLRDTAEPTSVEEAVTSFREQTEGEPHDSPVPPGVYEYATDGYERTDALTGVTHRYPRRSTITVTADACGVRLRWDVLRGRSTTWTFCVADQDWELREQDERHTFFGRTERTTYACAVPPFRLPGGREGRTLPVSCTTGDAEERGELAILGRERVRVGRRAVPALHVRKTSTFSGAIRGSARYDLWFARDTGVPLRLVLRSETANDSAVGEVRYAEEVTLRLLSLAPRR
ncbi:MAG TPA: hypothetical protein VNJ53_07435 [Gaiellaceae bacterium]|nr:hypothetical protein [Gaiellaceae bacterium]